MFMNNILKVFICFMITFSCVSFILGQNEEDWNLVGYWTFDNDSSGAVIDLTNHQTHGTPHSVSYSNVARGKCMDFFNDGNAVIFPGKDSSAPEQIGELSEGSISLWFKYKSLPDGQILPILYYGERDTGTAHNSLIIEIGHGRNPANRKLYFTIVNRRFCYDSGENLDEDRWYHFVAVVSDSGNTGYLDGKWMHNRHYNLGSDSTYSDFFSDVPEKEVFSLGYGRYGQEDPFFNFQGSLDEVGIWKYALSHAEVSSLYEEGKAKIIGSQSSIITLKGSPENYKLYPNPGIDALNISSPETINELKIIGLRGYLHRIEHPHEKEFSINISTLPKGIYFIQGNQGSIQRFIKQ